MQSAFADQVIMKDGTVYKGKILIDSDKAVLIGNPPFDPNAYYLESKDIDKIIYEEYHQNPPAERKRGLTIETRLSGNVFSSDQLPIGPATGLYAGVGFRVHPAVELNGGIDWIPAMHSGNGLSVSNGLMTRGYQDFWQYSPIFTARVYPFFNKKWVTEPYLAAGYSWERRTPAGSGDLLTGSGWHAGFGVIRPLTTHLFLECQMLYRHSTFDSMTFLGQKGNIQPEILESAYSFSAGISYRL